MNNVNEETVKKKTGGEITGSDSRNVIVYQVG